MQNAVQRLRLVIDNIDSLLIKLLNKRFKISLNIQKLKNGDLGFSPSRERQILSKCSSDELRDTYLCVLSNSRRMPDSIKWYFIESSEKKRCDDARRHLVKIFGAACSSGLKTVKSNETIKPEKNEKYIIISPEEPGAASGAQLEAGGVYKYCQYRLCGELIFTFYSNIKPAFDNDLNVVINL